MLDGAPVIPLIAFALVTTAMVGCIGTDEVPVPGDPPPTVPLAFANDRISATLWENGTFTVADGAQGPATRVVDVTDHLPSAGPVRIAATLTYEAGPAPSNPSGNGPASMDVIVDTGEAPVYTEDGAEERGSDVSNVTFGRTTDDPVEVVVRYNANEGIGGFETPYSLKVSIEAIPHAIPIDAPAAVDVPEEAAEIQILPAVHGRSLSAHAWSPDDSHLGYEQTGGNRSLSFSVEAAGEYVVMPNGSAVVFLADEEGEVIEAESPLRLLDYEFAWGERRSLPPDGPETWDIEVARVPLTVAIRLNSQQGDSTVIDRISFRAESEKGTVWDFDVACSPNPGSPIGGTFCFAAGATTGFDGALALAPFGDENLASGAYEITVRYNASDNIDATPGWVHYAR